MRKAYLAKTWSLGLNNCVMVVRRIVESADEMEEGSSKEEKDCQC